MTRLLALVYALSVTLSVTAAATIPPEKNDAFSPPMLVATGSPNDINYPMQGAHDIGHHTSPTTGRIDPTTGSSRPGPSPPAPPFLTSRQQQTAMDHGSVRLETTPESTAADNEGLRSRRFKRGYDLGDYPPSRHEIANWAAPWPKLLASEVVIYTGNVMYLSLNGEVRWDREGRVGPVFRKDYGPATSERFFLERSEVQDNNVLSYAGGAVAIKSSANSTLSARDSHGALIFHFEPVGDRYRIRYSENGVPYGPPAHLEDDADTLFYVRAISAPDRISAFKILTYTPGTTYTTTTEYATTACSGDLAKVDYSETQGSSYHISVLEGEPDAFLQPPLPGVSDRTWNATIQNGTFVSNSKNGWVSLTPSPFRATLAVVTKEEVYSRILWTATMTYEWGGKFTTRVVAGWSNIWRINRLISAKSYPGVLFSPETCTPFYKVLKVVGINADGKRSTLQDFGIDYPWVPRLAWM